MTKLEAMKVLGITDYAGWLYKEFEELYETIILVEPEAVTKLRAFADLVEAIQAELGSEE